MMNKTAKILIFVVLGLLLFSFKALALPQWSSNTSTIPNNYNLSFISEFSIFWSNNTENENITACNFTLGRPDGTIIIYPVTPSPTVPPSLCYKNFTQDELGSAGNYNYTWSASNDIGDSSTSDMWNFTINPFVSLLRLFLDGNECNRTYNLNYQNANFTALLNIPEKNINLNSNIPGFTTQSSIYSNITNLTNLNNSGLFYLNASFDGDQNYSSNYTTYYVNVTTWSNITTSPFSPTTYSSGKNYQFNITWQNKTPIYNVYFVWKGVNTTPSGNRTINANTTEFYLNEAYLPADSYNYYFYVNDTNGILNSSEQFSYIINKRPVDLSWTSPSTSPPWTFNTGTTGITVRCAANDSIDLALSVTLGSISNTLYSSSPGSVSDSPTSSAVATYLYSCLPKDSTNYSGSNSGILYFQSTGSGDNQGNQQNNQQTATGNFTIASLPLSLSINQGESKATSFDLKNTLSYNLLKTNVSLTGIDSSWYSFSSASISSLIRNVPEKITLTFNIPSSAEAKDYTIKISAKGGIPGSNSAKTAEAIMKLTVVSTQPSKNENATEPRPTLLTTNESTNQTNQTTNQTAGLTGLSIRPEYISNIVLIAGFISAALVFIYREKVTFVLTGGKQIKPKVETTKKETRENIPEPKFKVPKPNIKMPKILSYKLNINLVKNAKDKEDKNK